MSSLVWQVSRSLSAERSRLLESVGYWQRRGSYCPHYPGAVGWRNEQNIAIFAGIRIHYHHVKIFDVAIFVVVNVKVWKLSNNYIEVRYEGSQQDIGYSQKQCFFLSQRLLALSEFAGHEKKEKSGRGYFIQCFQDIASYDIFRCIWHLLPKGHPVHSNKIPAYDDSRWRRYLSVRISCSNLTQRL